MFGPWILFSVSIVMIVSVQPKRLPNHIPTDDTIGVINPEQSQFYLPQSIYVQSADWEKNAYQVDSRQSSSSEPRSEEVTTSERMPCKENANGDSVSQRGEPVAVINEEAAGLIDSLVDKRTQQYHTNHHRPTAQQDNWDFCFVRYDIKDLGHQFHPRYIETANCHHHLPQNMSRRNLKCTAIHYHVQVLTQRKDTDPEEDEIHRLPLPDALKDWRFVSIPVNVGCHCVTV